ncbi:2-hydroxyacid dehydrogenase [Microbacterium sp. CFBP9023]|uniref:2-hydroxyacid dehydrogenase n=1 Tax=Microbacterium sp. CFBP9023 TaxID=3096535 RepID=UPI002A6A5F49|nr:2-hydroxyacid dehydrogenase [Microbacterium sp. CFBP9023]MDY0983998.1 2-hydroxyacid dehydrogenase [Microbacterium sp. CFBP9023]
MTNIIDAPSPVAPGSVAQAGPLLDSLERTLQDEYSVVRLPDDLSTLDPADAAKVRAVVTSGRNGVPSALMAALPNLEIVTNFGVGYDTTDVAQAVARGIQVTHTPDVLTDCVADTALGLMLDVFRRFGASERFLREGRWESGGFPLTRRFSGSTVGLLGLGRIGQAIARRAAAFDATILYTTRRPVEEVPWEHVASAVELARRSDVLVIAVPGGAATVGLVDAEVIRALGPDGFLVNIARGSVVDEDALIAALEAGEIAGAGLDVFAQEPHVPERLIRDDVTLLPHVGSGTHETRRDMRDLTLANLRAYLAAEPLPTPVPEMSAL